MFVKISQAGLGLIVAIVLTRLFGAEVFGIYAYAIATATLIAVFTRFGFHVYVIYAINKLLADKKNDEVGTVLLTAWGTVLGLSVVAGVVLFALASVWSDWTMSEALMLAAPLIAAVALMQVSAGALEAFGHVVLGVSLEGVGKPVLLLVFVGTALLVKGQDAITYHDLIAYYILSDLLLFLFAFVLIRKWVRRDLGGFRFNRQNLKPTILEARPFLMANAMIQLYQQSGIIAVGIFFAPAQVAFFRVATQTASLIPFGLQALQSVMRPRIARLYRENKTTELQKEVTWSIRLLVVIQSPVMAVALFYPEILAHLFGPEFIEATTLVVILAIGQSYSILSGLNGAVLNMSGFANVNATVSATAFAFVVALMWPFITLFGVAGAAAAVCVSRIYWNTALVFGAARYSGVHTSIFGKLPISQRSQ
ncbi:hypothetical protein ACMU_18000 [Actibacterium mucosum KCTC 23349]|uniref:Polysaccharide biosynthesis protein C-terminal domain-containing protein n=1 Tax=Actibacterium mucosum KCTC 23349 TaxID=1454373 RepID=A0A037ZDN9_9RHOB|nr:oligosaccharide flippase family protein [Actibacterium mucosum]KAJ54599.1 hypothetical protein ACMU_18000 [Actibacterium mucosum KCTC 23349]